MYRLKERYHRVEIKYTSKLKSNILQVIDRTKYKLIKYFDPDKKMYVRIRL